MKKLMIAAAIVCAAAISQAAVVTWGFASTEIYDSADSDYLYTGTAMLFKGVVEATANADGTYALNFKNATLIGDPVAQNGDGTFGPVSYSDGATLDPAFSADGGDKYSLILFEDDNVTDFEKYEGKYFLATGTSAETQDKSSGNFYVSMNYDYGFGGSDWKTAAAVPEPTSGLLLLLGVAGLALRRRHA